MKIETISKINRVKNYLTFDKYRKDRLIAYNLIKSDKTLLDYGAGYFYQSIPNIKISGLRDTEYRSNTMKLAEIEKSKNILDIGCHTGAIVLFKLNEHNCDGIDYNHSCIKVANYIKDKFSFKKCNFIHGNFMNYNLKKKYDVILSLANHHTYDGGITNTKHYFNKIKSIINPGGEIYLESHHPQIETKEIFYSLYKEYLSENFKILRDIKYENKNFLDNGRSFLLLKNQI